MAKAKSVDDAALRAQGIQALNDTLGPVGALRFLSLLQRDATDYVKLSRRLYAGQSVDEVYERAAQLWDQ